ncbi:MAG TPA: hypothetical protein VF815_02655 [Myxococcaceae bacterium]
MPSRSTCHGERARAVLPRPVFDDYAGCAGEEHTAHVMALAGACSVSEVTAELVTPP